MSRSLLVFIIAFIIDLILKSIKDKKKIEKAMDKKKQQLEANPEGDKDLLPQIDEKPIEIKIPELLIEGDTVELGKEPVNVTTATKEDDSHIKREIFIKDDIKKSSKNPKAELKKDILKGIIYSEILSEPKSLKNIRKSI
ncbi:hypothetical protein [Tepidimicrobium xylanilyticum]|uniref:Uncharacterized protein n=1 Tax=Tepidimicrobium xylanilyticum TaxID=1123352 RepID=A0A1H2T319_9FIRM|nr:hypothetical protein [Tepidimicrobium xylanilyticum]GMG96040.1 hypothetical protein EN5CB1_08660 [Tepidimicrobium xylanilyticum]SDW38232.1 hypothetical protein SAMN05660923_00617 [Tepidimicrobium xylanilyticum]